MTLAEAYDAAVAKRDALRRLVADIVAVDVPDGCASSISDALCAASDAARAELHAAAVAAEEAHEAYEAAPKCKGCGEPIAEHDAAETQGCAAELERVAAARSMDADEYIDGLNAAAADREWVENQDAH